MKRTFTLIIAILIAVSLMGQITKTSSHGHKKFKKQKEIEAFESKKSIGINIKKHHRIINPVTSPKMFKSTQAIKQQLDSLIDQEYDEDLSQWVNYGKDEFTYDADRNIAQYIYYEWYEDQWVGEMKFEFSHDANGKMTSGIVYDWNEYESEWILGFKMEYTYNSNGEMAMETEYEWDENTSQWIPFYKLEITYDSNGNMTHEINFEWDESTSQWIDIYKQECTYDSNDNMILAVFYYWDEGTSDWVAEDKDEYTYDATGKITQYIYFYWDQNTSDWEFSWKGEYSFDANGNTTQEIFFNWDSQWLEEDKYVFTYDLSYNISDLIIPSSLYFIPDNTESIINKPVDYMYYYYNGDSWAESDKGTYYYSEQEVTAVSDISENHVKVYPNPATETITISLRDDLQQVSIDIIDIQGKIVMQQMILNNGQVFVKQLPKGIYFYRLSSNNKVIKTDKILIK